MPPSAMQGGALLVGQLVVKVSAIVAEQLRERATPKRSTTEQQPRGAGGRARVPGSALRTLPEHAQKLVAIDCPILIVINLFQECTDGGVIRGHAQRLQQVLQLLLVDAATPVGICVFECLYRELPARAETLSQCCLDLPFRLDPGLLATRYNTNTHTNHANQSGASVGGDCVPRMAYLLVGKEIRVDRRCVLHPRLLPAQAGDLVLRQTARLVWVEDAHNRFEFAVGHLNSLFPATPVRSAVYPGITLEPRAQQIASMGGVGAALTCWSPPSLPSTSLPYSFRICRTVHQHTQTTVRSLGRA